LTYGNFHATIPGSGFFKSAGYMKPAVPVRHACKPQMLRRYRAY
jgi:hypothetical protein